MTADEAKRILIIDDDKALADLLAGFFKNAGFDARTVLKGKEGISMFSDFKPHLVLLDILLPDINGLDALKQLREKKAAEHCAFILMSGIMKDQKTRTESVSKHGADAFVEKPFKVRELHNTLLKCLGLETIEEKAPSKTAANPAASVASSPAAAKGPKAPVIPEPNVTIEAGELGSVDIPRILAAFFTAKVSGVLKVNSQDTVKAIYFEEGKPIFAASNTPADRLGEIAVRMGQVTKEQVDAALKICNDHTRIGTALVQSNAISASDLYSLIQLQVREMILSLFAWASGRYAFSFEDLAGRELIKLQTPPADLVIEGIKRFYNLERLDRMIVSRDRVLAKHDNPHFRFQQLHLAGVDAKIFDLINGKRSIAQIIADIKQPPMPVLQIIYALLAMKVAQDCANT